LAVCLFKSEKYDPQKDNRLQIYGWGINGIYAKWRGTFLCHPFKKVIFTDVNGDGKTELLSLEEYKNQKYLSIYHWNGFGFDLISQKRIGEEIDDASLVEKTGRHP
jgi:hypothetical protein